MDLGQIIDKIVPVLTLLLGFWLSRFSESRKQLLLTKTQAYADYLRGVFQFAGMDKNDPKRKDVAASIADAKVRISIYGSSRVLEALAKFERKDDQEANHLERFVILCRSLRREAFGIELKRPDDQVWVHLYNLKKK